MPGDTRPRLKVFAEAPFIVVSLLFIALLISGAIYMLRQVAETRSAVQLELKAIADLKAAQIENWRGERLGDARFFHNARFVAEYTQRFLTAPDSDASRADMLNWMQLLKSGDRYASVELYDRTLNQRLVVGEPGAHPMSPETRDLARQAFTNGLVMKDFHRESGSDSIFLDLAFSIFEPPRSNGPGSVQTNIPPIAAVVLHLDPHQFVYPLIQSWPLPSRTAETFLVRREGNDVVYLNDLKYRTNAALNFRIPITRTALPAARIVLGVTNVLEGTDYRGVGVVAAGRQISGSPWFIIAKQDKSEIYGPIREKVVTMVAILVLLSAVTAMVLVMLWRRRNTEFLRRQLMSEQERLALLGRNTQLMQNANDIILIADNDWSILEANTRTLESYGYSLAELHRMKLADLRVKEFRSSFEENVKDLRAKGHILFETVHQRKDGSTFPVEVSSRIIDLGGAKNVLTIIRDITQRKTHEREILRLNRLYSALSQINQCIVRARSREELLQDTCRVLVQYGGIEMAWIGMVEPASQEVKPVAQFGDSGGYLGQIHVRADDTPEGHGPVGCAIRSGKAGVLKDFATDPEVQPWRLAAARAGWHSAAAFPIRDSGTICGAIAMYSVQPGFFESREVGLLEEAALDVSFALDYLANDLRRIKAEEDLRRLNAELEQRVKQRTQEMEAKNRELEIFAYSVSHDLKAPLRGIEGFSRLLVADHAHELNEEGRAFLQRIQKAATQMGALIDDLLRYSRLEREEVKWGPVNLRTLTEQILDEFRADIAAGKVIVLMNLACTEIESDSVGLSQALRNLIGNAVKFSAKTPQPKIEITSSPEDDHCLVYVRDNGVGFDMEYREKIFEIFQRLQGQEYSGTGIGLAIVRKAMQRIGGRVWAESEPGKGATFYLQIPRRKKQN